MLFRIWTEKSVISRVKFYKKDDGWREKMLFNSFTNKPAYQILSKALSKSIDIIPVLRCLFNPSWFCGYDDWMVEWFWRKSNWLKLMDWFRCVRETHRGEASNSLLVEQKRLMERKLYGRLVDFRALGMRIMIAFEFWGRYGFRCKIGGKGVCQGFSLLVEVHYSGIAVLDCPNAMKRCFFSRSTETVL